MVNSIWFITCGMSGVFFFTKIKQITKKQRKERKDKKERTRPVIGRASRTQARAP
jgi:hypothetical protein